jgi:Ca2+-transporting ATPase
VLLASSALAFVLGETVDALVVLAVVVLNTIIGFAQEYRAGKEIEALVPRPRQATALRDGGRVAVSADDLVPGDVVLLAGGGPGAGRRQGLSSKSLQVDESALTGRIRARREGARAGRGRLGDRRQEQRCPRGTLATYGTAAAVVATTGNGRSSGASPRCSGRPRRRRRR